MSRPEDVPGADPPVDLSQITADDALLDALGQGEPAPGDDRLAGALAAWRTDLDTDPPAPPSVGTPASARRPQRRPGRRLLVAVAAATVLLAGLAFGVERAGPTSPLWPIARVAFPDRVEPRLAERHIALARQAATDGRYADAQSQLDQAEANVERIRDQALVRRLRAEIEALRRTLPAGPVTPPPAPSPTPAPSGAPPGGGNQPPGGGVPGLPPTGVPVPPLPTLPTPPVPVPSVPGIAWLFRKYLNNSNHHFSLADLSAVRGRARR